MSGDEVKGGDVVPGERSPDFLTEASTGTQLGLDDFLGKVPVALSFVGTLSGEAADDVIRGFNDVFVQFGRHRIQLLIVTPDDQAAVRRRRQEGITVPLLADDDGVLLQRFASSSTIPATVLIDEAGAVERVVEGGSPHDHVAAVLEVAVERGG